MKDNDKNRDQDLDDDDFNFDFDDDSDFGLGEDDITLDWDDDDEEAEEVLGPPKPNIPKKRLIEGFTLEWANFENRTFIDCQIGRFIACKFEDCNIISFSGEGYGFRECEFIRCKWSGNECIDDCYYYSNCKYTDCEENYY